MSTRNFHDLLRVRWAEGKFVCVGLDSALEKIPFAAQFGCRGSPRKIMFKFNMRIIEATSDLALGYKLNSAFYEAQGPEGMEALHQTIQYAHEVYPDNLIIYDCKRNDIGNSSEGYAIAAFDVWNADAATVNPYLGQDALQPFLDRKEKGIFPLVRTSNPGAGEFQNLECNGRPLYLHVAERIAKFWNTNGNCGLVVGATAPSELRTIRGWVGSNIPILIPGIGTQGGELEATVLAGKNSYGQGMIINASRSIIFASPGLDFAEAARRETQKLHNQITSILKGE